MGERGLTECLPWLTILYPKEGSWDKLSAVIFHITEE